MAVERSNLKEEHFNRSSDLSATALLILVSIANGPLTTLQVEQRLSVGKTAVYKHLVQLRHDGLIEKKVDPAPRTGRPRYIFTITKRGRAVVEHDGDRPTASTSENEHARERSLVGGLA